MAEGVASLAGEPTDGHDLPQTNDEGHAGARFVPRNIRVPRRRRAARIARLLGATMTVLALALVMSGVGLYFLLQGQAVENSAITRAVERRVQDLIGARYTVELGSTTVGLDANGLLSLSSSNVAIRRAGEDALVSSVGRVVLGLRVMSVLRGEPQIDAIIVEDTALQAGLLPLPQSKPPSDIAQLLDAIQAGLSKIETQFASTGFRLFEIRGATVDGLALGRAGESRVTIEDFEIRRRRNAALTASGVFKTSQSDVALEAEWRGTGEEGKTLDVSVDGLSSREWAADPDGDTGQFGLDALVSAQALFPYSPDGVAGEPTIAIRLGGSTLRIGSEATTSIASASFNLRLSPLDNRIMIDESLIEADGMTAHVRGAVEPETGIWASAPLRFELAADPVLREPTIAGEQQAPFSGNARGRWVPADRLLIVEDAQLAAGTGELAAQAEFRFVAGKTPSIRASANGRNLDVAVIKQAWPFFLAPPARSWAFAAISGGNVGEVSMKADLPPDVFGRFRLGAKMTPEQYQLVARFEGVRLRTFGELPFIEDASGEFAIRGMSVEASMSAGHVAPAPGRRLPLEIATYRVADFAVRPNPAEVRVSAEGELRDLAVIAQARPLEVMSRLKISPGSVSGRGDADVVARFPVKRGLAYDEVDWNAIVNLADAASTDKVFDRRVDKATLQVFATRNEAQIKGKAALDGVMTDIAMVEPIGDSGIAGERRIATVLDEAQRKKLGLVLDPVLTGNIKVEMEQRQDGPQRQTVHLEDAELLLPWIGWSKGKGVGGKATYTMRTDNGVTWLDDFYIDGPGFTAAGRIALDKGGLRHADFTDISLNEGDSFSLKLERKGKTYSIGIEGLRYDARSLINKIFHEKGFGEGKSDTDVVVSASLGEVRGFNGQTLKGLQLSYATAGGRFDGLSLRGSFTDATNVRIYASTKEGRTQFEIDASEAGGTLAFIDIYGRMRGGELRARLARSGDGPFTGPVRASNFIIEGEPRIAALVSEPVEAAERGAIAEVDSLRRIDVQRVRFQEARGTIEKGDTYLRVTDGIFNNSQIGLTFDGIVFDKSDRMDLVGTFLPAIGLSRAIGSIPFVGEILGNGRDSGLIGMTFRLSGPMRNPQIEVNPMSLVAPGVFRKVFEFRN